MKISAIIVIIVCILSACNSDKTPNYVIPQDDMADIIFDIHMTDGLLTMTRIRREIVKKDSSNFYDEILTGYGYTRKDFDTSVYYYSYNMNEYDNIYKNVLDKLAEMEAKLKEGNILESEDEEGIKDINLEKN